MDGSASDAKGYWPYVPSLPAAVTFCVLYAILALSHLFWRYRMSFKFANCLIASGVFEAIGYGFRAYAHNHWQARMPYSVQAFFILVAPNLLAASMYQYFERLADASGMSHLCVLRPRLLTRLFIFGDVLSFVALIAGSGFVDSNFFNGAIRCGNYLIIVGLVFQLLLLWVFTGIAVAFHIRLVRNSAHAMHNPDRMKKIKRMLSIVYAGAQIVAGRNMFRLTTTAMDPSGYMARHEWTFYVFDGAQIAQVMLINLTWYYYGYLVTATAGNDSRNLIGNVETPLEYQA